MELRRIFISLLFISLNASASAAPDETLFGREADRYGVKHPAVTFTMFGGNYLNGLDQQLYTSRDYLQKTWNMGLRAGYAFNPNFEIEAALGFTPTQTSTAEENVYIYSFNGLGQLPITDEIVPYLTLGLGWVTFNPDNLIRTNHFAVNYGAGLKWFFLKNLALRPDVRALTSFDPSHTAILLSLNLTYYLALNFNAAKKADAASAVVVIPTPTPQPAPEKIVAPVFAPAPTPSPEPTPASKSELQDFSGVIEGIHFKTASATIRSDSYETLDRAAEFFKKHPKLNVRIEGHTDDTGSANLNNRLSKDRARAVLRYLKSHGADKNAFETVGYGSSRSAASNATETGRSKNRRIEFKILNPEAL